MQKACLKPNKKSFVTQHAAFNYLALDYGLKQVAISGLSPDAEPSVLAWRNWQSTLRKIKLPISTLKKNASQALANTLSKEAGVKTDVLNPLESLTEEDTKAGENYISVMEKNLKALKQTTDQEGPAIEPEKAEDTKTVQNGYFEDTAVKDRTLSDYAGNWQSVYPFLEDGTLDQVFDYKAKLTG